MLQKNPTTSPDDRRQKLEFVQPHQLRIRRKVRNLRQIGRIVLPIENPADVAVNEALLAWRMHVFLRIGVKMVMSMFRSPPKDAFLGAALREESKNELKRPAR